jgi:hypothetical protein
LIAQIAGRVSHHHTNGIGIEFVGNEKPAAEPLYRLTATH